MSIPSTSPQASQPADMRPDNIKETYQLTSTDRTMLVMPLFHVHGLLCGLLAPLYTGGSMVVPAKFSASDFWRDFITHRANWYTAVPTIHQILLKNPPPEPKPQIRFIRSCSSPLSPTVFHQLEATYNAPVLEAYAMTEAAHQMTSNPLPPGQRKPGSVGVGQGVDVRILDAEGAELPRGAEGEICVRGDNVTGGYLNNADANASSFTKDGFFRTGDQGRLDEDGYVSITGRIKELINKGGEKISPIELDNVLTRHPRVAEAVSFAIPDDMYGQDIGVAVVSRPGEDVSADELKAWVAEKLVKFKVPKEVSTHPPPPPCSFIRTVGGKPTFATTGLLYRCHAQDCDRKDPAAHCCRGNVEARLGPQGQALDDECSIPVHAEGEEYTSACCQILKVDLTLHANSIDT